MPVLGAILIMAGANLADSVGRVILPLFVDTLQRDTAHVNSATGLVLAGAALTSAVSALLLGRLADRVGYRGILLACAERLLRGLMESADRWAGDVSRLTGS